MTVQSYIATLVLYNINYEVSMKGLILFCLFVVTNSLMAESLPSYNLVLNSKEAQELILEKQKMGLEFSGIMGTAIRKFCHCSWFNLRFSEVKGHTDGTFSYVHKSEALFRLDNVRWNGETVPGTTPQVTIVKITEIE